MLSTPKIFSISINPLSLHNKQNFLSKTLFAFKLIGIFFSRYESSIGLKHYRNSVEINAKYQYMLVYDTMVHLFLLPNWANNFTFVVL